jgi:hypothetical protein
MLKRFWFEFEPFGHPTALNIGCGVTARDYDDAVNILREHVFTGQPFPKVLRVLPDVDVRGLDKDHVIPNMGVVTQRGVWFPLGF